MKKIFTFGLLLMGSFALTAQTAQSVAFTKQDSSLDAPRLLGVTNNALAKQVVFQSTGGVKGGCYKITKPAGSKRSVTVLLNKNTQLNVLNASAALNLKLSLKGKGSVRLTFLCYDSKKRYFTQFDKPFRKVDTANAWKSFEFSYTPNPQNKSYIAKIAYVMPVLIVDSGEFLLDDWKGEVKVPSAKIQLDD